MAELADTPADLPITASERVFRGRIWNVARETVDLGEAGEVTREFVEHTGAVAILALDEEERVVLVNQYRHPVRRVLWELPAGLLDVEGEALVDAARRELAEEADLVAGRWDTLGDFYTTPGGSDEFIRIFLARDLRPVAPADRHERRDEELGMEVRRVPLTEVVTAVLGGRIHNPSTAFGVLAAHTARQRDWATLRPVDAPF